MTVALALTFGLLIGVSLGALGGGGSILTVPVLVYALGLGAQSATTASLVIVGLAASTATIEQARSGRVRWRAGLAFGAVGVVASLAGTALNRHVDQSVLLVSFAILMLVAAAAMLAKTRTSAGAAELAGADGPARVRHPAAVGAPASALVRDPAADTGPALGDADGAPVTGTVLKVLAAALVVGFLTGFLGVGGGFIIVPALVLSLRYDMPTAVGTSLLVIAVNSGVALLARSGHETFDWSVIAPFTAAALVGSVVGKRLADRASGTGLTRTFAVLLVAVAGYVLVRTWLGG